MPLQKLPTASNVQKVIKNLNKNDGIIYLKGQVLHERDDTDVELSFRQESNFFYLTGVTDADFHVVVSLSTGKITLIAPDIVADHVMWMGLPDTPEELLQKYDVNDVVYASKLDQVLQQENPQKIYTLPICDTSALPQTFQSKVDKDALKPAIYEARMYKAKWEVEMMREANKISSDAHIKLMKEAKAGLNEQQLHALFLYESARNGAFFQSYNPIVAAGSNAATLHYGKNNAGISPDQFVLIDAGAELNCYASDITRTFPAGGKFSQEQKDIYEIVLEMQKASFELCKPGVEWEDIHRLALRVACRGLIKLGVLKGEEDELIAKHIPACIFPHGLGHSIGIDVHDVGGYLPGVQKIDEPGIRNLRMRRTLQAGMAVTVEPGIYFCDFIIDPLLKDEATRKYFDIEKLNQYKKVGGVRIEDDIVITETGFDNLTTVPKEIHEIEALMA
ncbi:hypothetical protein INT44_004926 [Umbelopsis vinacea]|uniref:Aminopeptidase P N-terminal domain-containing protein n=1 Tax=Umbelopsis vinacea TaxID=44442 RepID=A0A8H7Q7I9_9FUNG|nr:hypothetical protein INT44_004926 [Umbelopsis vinacea]KAI9285787.1 peptidase M24, structural domain-containing protein [Umbelopsis sp. AD052]